MLSDLVSFKSVKATAATDKPFGEEVDRAFKYMLAKAESDGFETFDADGYGGHIEWMGAITGDDGEILDSADGTLGIPVHLDVVPPGDGWSHDPWESEIVDGRLYGRGTSDDKGAVAMIYYAMKALKEAGFVPSKNVRLVLGLDEETGCSGLEKYFEKTTMPDFGFSPDADFPVINGEKGILVFDIAKKLESSREKGLCIKSIKGGNAPNMVPDFCKAILVYEDESKGKGGKAARKKKNKPSEKDMAERNKAFSFVKEAVAAYREENGLKISCKGVGSAFEVSAQGLSAHGSTPWKGQNAISILMDFLSTLPFANESACDFIDFYKKCIGSETDGRGLGIVMEDSLSGSLIVNAGIIDMSREAAVLTVNIRYPVSKNEDDVYDAMRKVLDENGLGVVKLSNLAPLYFTPEESLVETLLDVYIENTGDTSSKPLVIGGGTYARSFPNSVAFGPRFPDEEDVMHQKDEYISIDSMMKAAHIYADAIYRLTSADKV
jgi:dipeptidase, putative